MYKLCQELVWLDDSQGRASTYCMRAAGHEGKHNPAGNFEPAATVAKIKTDGADPLGPDKKEG
jgi:hypothetical protein